MPRAALLSIHARVAGTKPSTWEDPSLVQLWGPRFNVFVVAARDLADLTIVRYPHHPLADRVWALRHNLTAYDATFVALGEALGVPLVTCDARLAGAQGHQARVELSTAEPGAPGG
jgi:hypothetical protein